MAIAEICENDWIQEAIRLELPDVIENIALHKGIIDHLRAEQILTEAEVAQVNTDPIVSSSVINLLVEKEDPTIWPAFFEILLKDGKSCNRHVIKMIKDQVPKLKENPERKLYIRNFDLHQP